jgi:hypothetical protein
MRHLVEAAGCQMDDMAKPEILVEIEGLAYLGCSTAQADS